MIEGLPAYISIAFVLTTLAPLLMFYFAVKASPAISSTATIILTALTGWLILQALLTMNGLYSTDTRSVPPRILLLVIPPLLVILYLFFTEKGRHFMDNLSLARLTWLHIVRIPVELILYWLFLNQTIPELMTFAGRNFDILAGISAPFISWYGLKKKRISKNLILAWNIIALLLLINIVTNAVLAAPFAFQKFAFDQPNVAVLYFPFSWLPGFIVPMVLFSHLVSIRRLLKAD